LEIKCSMNFGNCDNKATHFLKLKDLNEKFRSLSASLVCESCAKEFLKVDPENYEVCSIKEYDLQSYTAKDVEKIFDNISHDEFEKFLSKYDD